MRRAVLVALLLGLTQPAQAAPSSAACWVSPDPAPVGSDVTVYGSGLAPNQETYWLWVSQPGNQIPGAHPAWGDSTDASGNFVATFNLDTVYGGPLVPGTVKLQIKPSVNGLPSARCDFQVT